VQVSGEAVSTRLLERFAEQFSAEFHNMYGQTETSEVAAWEGRTVVGKAGVPIGKQIGAYRLFILDAALELVPPGVPGELCVAGVGGLSRGYHGRPDLTAESFVPNPYAISPGERLYRTGDLVAMDEQGVISYLGRLDQQTKIRGCRVEVGEVEAVLARHPAVQSCAVVARPDEEGASQLVAYFVGAGLHAADLAAHVAHFLPNYMLPAYYVQLDALPLTASGKLDRLKLPAPGAKDDERHSGDEAVRTPLETELRNLWKDVLKVENFDHTDNFFVIGGNSLKCLQVLNRVNARYGVQVSLRSFMSEPTIRGLGSTIEAALVGLVSSLSDDEAIQRLCQLEKAAIASG
jgi:acyl-coenzyme A synthetase/AMP-(fatty) acid ligase